MCLVRVVRDSDTLSVQSLEPRLLCMQKTWLGAMLLISDSGSPDPKTAIAV